MMREAAQLVVNQRNEVAAILGAQAAWRSRFTCAMCPGLIFERFQTDSS